mgnify:CR=1 FL=1
MLSFDLQGYILHHCLYFLPRSSSIGPFQFIPNAKSYVLPSVSVWHSMSCGVSSNWRSTVDMLAGNCIGRSPDGGFYLPFRHPKFSEDEIISIAVKIPEGPAPTIITSVFILISSLKWTKSRFPGFS